MAKQEKILWGFFAGILVFLYLLSSTDLIIKEKKTEIYPVSIVIGDTTDDYYVNFRKGVEQAADDYNVDISFITLFEKEDADSQTELEVMSLLKSCVSDFGQTLIMITHDETIAQMADEMIIIEDGKAVRR